MNTEYWNSHSPVSTLLHSSQFYLQSAFWISGFSRSSHPPTLPSLAFCPIHLRVIGSGHVTLCLDSSVYPASPESSSKAELARDWPPFSAQLQSYLLYASPLLETTAHYPSLCIRFLKVDQGKISSKELSLASV